MVIRNFMRVHSLRLPDDEESDTELTAGKDPTRGFRINSSHLDFVLSTDQSRISRARKAGEKPGEGEDNAPSGFDVAQDVWGNPSPIAKCLGMTTWTLPDDDMVVVKAARKSARNSEEEAQASAGHSSQRPPGVSPAELIKKWATEASVEATASQKIYVKKIERQMLKEEADTPSVEEPMRMLVLGEPGVGKSFTSAQLRALFRALGWKEGVEFQFLAFQAVVAKEIGGDTIHHFAHLSFRGPKGETADEQVKQASLKSKLRFIIIDEISMVTPTLFSDAERQIRKMVPRAGTYKINAAGAERSWGGVNVICQGDFYQLPPPANSGLSLDSVPDSVLDHASAEYEKAHRFDKRQDALDIFWLNSTDYVELKEQMRCADAWWHEVLTELRQGDMSEDIHAFLHGKSTSVVGSWLKNLRDGSGGPDPTKCTGDGACCINEDGTADECDGCATERSRRQRVVDNPKTSPAFKSDKFQSAKVITANNDLKYDICKLRAMEFARRTKQDMTYVAAVDVAADPASVAKMQYLIDRNGQEAAHFEKRKWLQKHDKACGDLYGMLPLVIGMPVALSNHQDRSSKNLLRGTDGVLVGWKCHPDEPQHSGGTRVLKHFPTVYVRFPNANWTLEGLDDQDPDNRGVYALTSMKAAWHLVPAHNNKPAMLKIMRQQIPICPAFARTAYSVQGMTLLAAVVDLCYDVIRFASTAILNAYIALSRVRKADDVLILRPFPRDVFTVGVPKSKLVLSKYMQAKIEVIECADPDCDGSVEGATCRPWMQERAGASRQSICSGPVGFRTRRVGDDRNHKGSRVKV